MKFFSRSRLATLTTSSFLGQIIFFSVTPILTRLYATEEFGYFAAIMSVASVVAVIASLRLDAAIPFQELEAKANSLFSICVSLIILVSFLSMMVVPILESKYSSLVYAFPVLVFSLSSYQVLSYRAVYADDINSIAKSKLLLGSTMAIFSLIFGLLGWGGWGLALGCALGYLAASAAIVLFKKGSFKFGSPDVKLIIENKKFPLLAAPSALINSGGVEALAVMLALLYGPEFAGLLAVAQRAVIGPLGIISRSWATVYYSDISSAIKKNPASLPEIYTKNSTRLLVFAVPLVSFVVVTSYYLFGWAFGEAWASAGLLVLLMAPYILMHFIVTPLSQTLNAINCQEIQLGWDLMRFVTVLVSLLVPYHLGLSAFFAVAVYSVLGAIMYFVLYMLTVASLRRYAARE